MSLGLYHWPARTLTRIASAGFEFIAEKVSHNPVVMAFHSHGKGWKLDGHAAPLQKFWGRSMEVNVSGDYNISFPDKDEVYSIRKPASFV